MACNGIVPQQLLLQEDRRPIDPRDRPELEVSGVVIADHVAERAGVSGLDRRSLHLDDQHLVASREALRGLDDDRAVAVIDGEHGSIDVDLSPERIKAGERQRGTKQQEQCDTEITHPIP